MTDTTITTPQTGTIFPDRRRALMLAGCALGAVAAAVAGARMLSGSTVRSTDDAYVNGHMVTISSQVPGAVTAVLADNTDRVQAGQALAELDTSDAHIALASAQAELARTVRRVHALYASEAGSAARLELRQIELARVRADLGTRLSMVGQGAVTEEETRHAADAVKTAQAALAVARHAHAEIAAQVSGTAPERHPDVLAALEQVRAAELAIERGVIRAPVGGMVAQRSVQLGKRLAAGERMMAVVPLDQLWVDANFKEVQLNGVCPGQPARVTADIYGSKIVYHGVVQEIEAGSGAAFALLPPQNASGNWIKVVQRVPVRISLPADELARHPLRIGMSTEVEIDTASCPAGAARHALAERTALPAEQRQAADRRTAAALDVNREITR